VIIDVERKEFEMEKGIKQRVSEKRSPAIASDAREAEKTRENVEMRFASEYRVVNKEKPIDCETIERAER
jgi:hypothetical protein